MYPILALLDEKNIDYKLIHTGQHYDYELSSKFMEEFEIRDPDYSMSLTCAEDPVEQVSEIMSQLNIILKKIDCSIVLVEGDTNSVAASAMVAVKSNILLGHLEAGLRSYEWKMPEEQNRRMVDHVSDILFTPTFEAAINLEREGVLGDVSIVGNTVIDAVEMCLQICESNKKDLTQKFFQNGQEADFILVTLHRAENVDNRDFLKHTLIAMSESDEKFIFPVHPRTIRRIHEFGLHDLIRTNVQVIDPTGYFEFLQLLRLCKFVITDSGGVQEEITSPHINKRALILRNSTERPESIQSGHAKLWKGHFNHEALCRAICNFSNMHDTLESKCPYGSGDAAQKIVKIIEDLNIESKKIKAL